MAQRGGCVVSHVRIGEECHSPLIPLGKADILVGFEPGEAVRCLPYLKPGARRGGVNVTPVQPVTASLAGEVYDVEAMLRVFAARRVAGAHHDGRRGRCADICGSPRRAQCGAAGRGRPAGRAGH